MTGLSRFMTKRKISDDIDIHTLSPLRLQAFWILDNDEGRLTATTIASRLVNDYDINASYQAVDSAFRTRPGTTHKNISGYRLMEKGRIELAQHRAETATPKPNTAGGVIFIESGKPFSAKNTTIKSMFDGLKTEIRICDPYIDAHTLDVLFKNLGASTPVRILTQTINDRPAGIVSRVLQDLAKEGFSIEVRVNAAGTLHDRYVMDDDHFWLSGNSLNHLGNKESFLVSLGEDVHDAMSKKFESAWSTAAIYK